jgi:hypothetical protein
MFYYPGSKILDWQITFEKNVCYISWYFAINKCYFSTNRPGSNAIKLPKMLPFDVSTEKIENLLLLC